MRNAKNVCEKKTLICFLFHKWVDGPSKVYEWETLTVLGVRDG